MSETKKVFFAAFVSIAAIAGFANTASALPIVTAPNATASVTCTSGLTTSNTSGPSNLSNSCIGSAIWHDGADANLAALSVSAGGTNDGPLGLGGFPATNYSAASISYYVDVVAGAFVPGVFTVPLLIDSTVKGMITGGGFLDSDDAVASVKITDPFSKQLYLNEIDCSAMYGCPVNTVSTIEQEIDVEILNPYNQLLVTMNAFAQYGSNAPSSVFASADPFIRIDPAFLALHPDFSLVFSPNVGNGPGDTTPPDASVPEPASISLMGLGLFAALFAIKRRGDRAS